MKEKRPEFNKGVFVNLLVKLSFLLFLFAFSIILTAFRVNINKVATWEFWVNTGFNSIAVVVSFNLIREMFIDSNKKSNQVYIYIITQYSRIVEFIHNRKLGNLVKKVVDDENQYRKELNENKLLSRITTIFSLEEIKQVDAEWEQKFLDKVKLYNLTKKEIKSLRKVCKWIINGKIKYNKITVNDLLDDAETDRDTAELTQLKMSNGQTLMWENFKKIFIWLLFVVLLGIIERQALNTSVLELMMEKGTLMLGSSVSGMWSGSTYIAKRRRILNNRCVMLNKIDEVVFTLPKEIVKS